ncbi:hypothetical protein FPSE_10363 [Fusarium pseudograminearum CS3096]|uniref:Uncharacterized protein n=1 Tax=Fusarium pseudograminearum (strain CS3096) TaxID=1028729 RepID=K3VB48_FUSPC|nr:hypothetical protein FPSE_10363 [Fusarium pseudograminearum CS3096]EKJ69463.1 hypothetical protein FPSE_10363 [Fusarium pseudograminearum CS3096]
MSGKIVLPDHSGVDHFDQNARRQYMKTVFRQLGLWDDFNDRPKSTNIRALCEDLVSQRGETNGYHNLSEPSFEYLTDRTVWRNVLRSGGIAYERAPWPWSVTDTPSHDDLTLGISKTYKRWRLSHGKSIEEPPGGGKRAHQFKKPQEASQSPAGQKLTMSSAGPAVEAKVQTTEAAPATMVAAGAPVKSQGAKASTKPPAGQKTTKSSAGPAGSAKVQTAKPAPATSVVAGAPVKSQGAKASTKPPTAAAAAQVDKVSQAFNALALEARAQEAAKVEALKKKAAAEQELLRNRKVRCTVAEAIFKKELLKIEAKELRAYHNGASLGNVLPVQSSIAEVEETLRGLPLPVRDVFGARSEEVVPECTLPPHDVREMIWEELMIPFDFGDCFLGPFEIAIPPWFDFHDLVLDGLDKIRENRLIDQDLEIAWDTKNGRPVSLVVGPHPRLFFDEETRDEEMQDKLRWARVRTLWHQVAEWLLAGYDDNPVCLADFLQARTDVVLCRGSAFLEFPSSIPQLLNRWDQIKANPGEASDGAWYTRENWDMWMPEIYAYISRPNGPNPAMLEDWVLREEGAFNERLTIATAIWSTFEANKALGWYDHVMSIISN